MLQILGLGLFIVVIIAGKSYWQGAKCTLTNRLDSKVILITGGNGGIGRITAIELAKRGASIIIGCRDMKKGREVEKEIHFITGQKPYVIQLDMTDLRSVDKFVEELKSTSFQRIDILINNAGIMAPAKRELTKQGFESQLGVNHLAHFHLTNQLLPLLLSGPKPRILNLSSAAHSMAKLDFANLNFDKPCNWFFAKWTAYGNSKLANILHAQELNRRYAAQGLKAVALHPGVVNTNLDKDVLPPALDKIFGIFKWYFYKSPIQGAQTTLYCALQEHEIVEGGGYYSDCKLKMPSVASPELAGKLWEHTQQLINNEFR